ncbi:MAG TPA: hypothetical protein VEU29_08750 [Actinomycetota bacterium]|nr:hypothetical protein [Actinomycetota bacterium]
MGDRPSPASRPAMRGPVQPGVDTSPTVPAPGFWGFVFGLVQLALGGVALALSIDEGFAAGKATFAAGGWRIGLGIAGAVLALLSVRGLLRVASALTTPLTPEIRSRLRRRGLVMVAIGAWLVAAAVIDPFARATVTFHSWTDPLFSAGGLYLLAMGLSLQLDITRGLRLQQLERGPSVPGTATILGATETGTAVGERPVMEITLEIDVNGRVYPASTRVVLEPDKRALATPGSTVDVAVDLVDPEVFKIDWRSWRGPAGDADPR